MTNWASWFRAQLQSSADGFVWAFEQIAPEQEQALLEYVAAGHGFAPIHCGSYCFLNSPKITALTGARFKSHGTGTFRETHTNVGSNHAILRGLRAIESWDETYVHEMHNEKERQVLSYRVEGDKKEPYTWVRTHGKGRVFYTAWGHDERTWGNADFVNLLDVGRRRAGRPDRGQTGALPVRADGGRGRPAQLHAGQAVGHGRGAHPHDAEAAVARAVDHPAGDAARV